MLGLAVGIYIYADQTIVETRNLHLGMMKTYENYEEHLEASDLVVIAELAEDPINVFTPYGGEFPDGYHLSKIKISKVIKGNEDLEQKVTDIREPYYSYEIGIAPGKREVFYGDYTKMEKGNK